MIMHCLCTVCYFVTIGLFSKLLFTLSAAADGDSKRGNKEPEVEIRFSINNHMCKSVTLLDKLHMIFSVSILSYLPKSNSKWCFVVTW